MKEFEWTKKREQAVLSLAEGNTIQDTADQVGVCEKTIDNWKAHPDFQLELTRCSLMCGIANKAARLRLANRMVRKIGDNTNRDLLDWLKFAAQESDGVRVNIVNLLESLDMMKEIQEVIDKAPERQEA